MFLLDCKYKGRYLKKKEIGCFFRDMLKIVFYYTKVLMPDKYMFRHLMPVNAKAAINLFKTIIKEANVNYQPSCFTNLMVLPSILNCWAPILK